MTVHVCIYNHYLILIWKLFIFCCVISFQRIFAAAQSGDVDTLQDCINKGAEVNCRIYHSVSSIIYRTHLNIIRIKILYLQKEKNIKYICKYLFKILMIQVQYTSERERVNHLRYKSSTPQSSYFFQISGRSAFFSESSQGVVEDTREKWGEVNSN